MLSKKVFEETRNKELVVIRGELMHMEVMSKRKQFSCENYISNESEYKIEDFVVMALKLNISLLIFDDFSISDKKKFLQSLEKESHKFLSLQDIYKELSKKAFSFDDIIKQIKMSYLEKENPIIIGSRKTIKNGTIASVKKLLSELRKQYEIICLKTNDKKVLKWAALDRRIDYIVLDASYNSQVIDKALCSLMKQSNKYFEFVFSPLFQATTEKELSTVIRNSKKMLKIIKSYNVPFILSMNPSTPYQLRNSSQMRYIGEFLDIPYNKTKENSFDYQFSNLVKNVIKLDETHLFEGVREVS
ncbi:MAG: RNase P subunit p30 family protein [Candidatus Thorarchaeota archaeon]